VLPGADLFLLNVIFICLLAGLFLTPASVAIILMPILFPAAQVFGLDPVHFGMVLNVALALGHITPPVGLTLLIAGNSAGVRLEHMVREILPFLLVLLAATCAVAWIPELTLALPG
jgi:C4-dicarboxylate transporter DctM subunit